MATLKHIASKNSDYTAIEAYLVYQHDEFSGKVILDKQGRPMLRESYILDTLECGGFSFATACLLANRKYGKNTQRDDIKSHQYIISFDPRDAADNGLTMEKAQALGLKFCEENLPGHPAIVCTHPDGHNNSGNIHVHIVIGSIRMREVERKPYMQKPRDWREGMKHSSTAQTMRHLRVEVMELCESAGLYQIDLLNGSKERVSEAEYWARRRGQQKLDLANAALAAAGQQPKQKKFETVKDTLRKQISSVLYAQQTTMFRKAANTSFFKIETAMGVHHAKSNKKNYVLMTGAFAICIVLFLTFSTLVNFMQNAFMPSEWTPELSIVSETNTCSIDSVLLENIKQNENVKRAYGRMFAYDVPVNIDGSNHKANVISYEANQFKWSADYLTAGSISVVEQEENQVLVVNIVVASAVTSTTTSPSMPFAEPVAVTAPSATGALLLLRL